MQNNGLKNQISHRFLWLRVQNSDESSFRPWKVLCQWIWSCIWILRLLICKPFVFWDRLSAASSSASRSTAANDRSCWGSWEDNTFWLTPLIKTGLCVSDWGLHYVGCALLPNVEPVHQVTRSFPPLNVTLTISMTSCLHLWLCLFSEHVYIWPRWLKAPPAQDIDMSHVCMCWLRDFHMELKCYACTQTGIWFSYEQHAFVADVLCTYINPNCASHLQDTRPFILTLLW